MSVLFTDFMGFSTLAEKMSAEEVIEELSTCFIGFDFIIEKHQLEKIKTIGDSYMCAGGIHEANVDHPFQIVKAGLEIREFMKDRNKTRVARGLVPLEVRIGVHVGPIDSSWGIGHPQICLRYLGQYRKHCQPYGEQWSTREGQYIRCHLRAD